tara:strand:- start:1456 stop:1677 length:222 start_codon:yes stop_codon:yes gene_type:complete
MTDYRAIGIAEGFIECTKDAEYFAAWQHLIDTGLVWELQGWFGRRAQELIRHGACTPSSQPLDNLSVDNSQEG